MRVANDDGGLLRRILLRNVLQFLLDEVLHSGVDRQHYVVAVDRRHLPGLELRLLLAAAVALRFAPAVVTAQEEIHVVLDAGRGHVLLVDVADKMRGERVVGIEPAVDAVAIDAADLQLLHLLEDVLVDAFRELDPLHGPGFAALLRCRLGGTAGGGGADIDHGEA